MSNDSVSGLLVNERIAIREQRNSSREKVHNERRVGLNATPTQKQIDEYDGTELTRICAALRCGRSANVSVTELRTLKQLLLHPEGVTSFTKDRGALHGLIGELSGKRPIHQLEAAYICVNLGLGEEEQCLPVCRAAGPYLIQFIEGTSYYLQEASAWALGNLAGASKKCAEILSAQGAVLQLVQLLSGPQKGLCLAAAYALSHIIHSKSLLERDEMVELARLSSGPERGIGLAAVYALSHIIYSKILPEDEMVELAGLLTASLPSAEPDLCILLYLLSCFPVCEKTLLDNKVVTKCITVLTGLADSIEKSPKTFTALLRTVGNLSSGLGGVELISQPECGHLCRTLLKAPYGHICKETAWICANLLYHRNDDVRTFAQQAGLHQALLNYKSTLLTPFKP